MRLYPESPGAALRHLITDLFVVAWVYAWVRAAIWLHDLVQRLAVPGEKLEGAGGGIADNLADAGDKVARIPAIGDELTAPFAKAADAARALSDAGREQQDLVGDLALALALAVLVMPLALVLLGWLPLRLRWMRKARAATVLRTHACGRDLLALRALARQPLSKLAMVDPDVTAKWRVEDPSVIDALATLELRSLGLRPGH